jgi:hypothetical protein
MIGIGEGRKRKNQGKRRNVERMRQQQMQDPHPQIQQLKNIITFNVTRSLWNYSDTLNVVQIQYGILRGMVIKKSRSIVGHQHKKERKS